MRALALVCLIALAISGCSRDVATAPVVPAALDQDSIQPVYVVSGRGRNEDGYFDASRSARLSYLHARVSLPPGRDKGDPPIRRASPDPDRHFAIAAQREFANADAFLTDLRNQLAGRPPQSRDLTLFVHGYFNSYSDALFRVAQVREDLDVTNPTVSFTWASAGHPLGYTHDRESVLFARDQLESLIRRLPRSGANRITLVAHSMGSLLVMETLRQMQARHPGWARRNIDAVILLSPDIALDLFQQQARKAMPLPQPFVVVSSRKDRVLQLSRTVNASEIRLGQASSAEDLAGLGVTIIDISNFGKDSAPNHFTVAESPELLGLLDDITGLNDILETGPAGLFSPIATRIEQVQNASLVVPVPPVRSNR